MNLVYQVRILPAALEEAKDFYNYIANDSPENATLWLEGLFGAVESLSSLPERCPIAPESTIIGVKLHVFLYRKYYRILYSIEKDIVRIYHIQHSSRAYLTQEDFFASSDTPEE